MIVKVQYMVLFRTNYVGIQSIMYFHFIHCNRIVTFVIYLYCLPFTIWPIYSNMVRRDLDLLTNIFSKPAFITLILHKVWIILCTINCVTLIDIIYVYNPNMFNVCIWICLIYIHIYV